MPGATSRTRARTLLLAALTAVLVAAVVELSAFVFFRLAGRRFAFADPTPYTLAPEQVRGLSGRFDPVIGWSTRYSTAHGERPRPHAHGSAFLMAFGDSHTYCDEVGDADTWEVALEDSVGADVDNFGVPGYAPDQALLRFRQKVREVQRPVAVLGFGLENINRVVNRYRPFYAPGTGLPYPKPRFVLKDGALVLLPNPITSAADLSRLADPRFIARMGRDDYWYSRWGLPHAGSPWPRLLLSRAVWTQALEARAGRNDTSA